MDDPLVTFLWGSGLRKTITSISGMIAAIAGAVVAVPPAWSALGLPAVASQVFVHSLVDPLQIAQNQTTDAINQLLLSQLQGQLYQAQQDRAKAPSATVDQRIQQLEQQIQQTQAKINQGH
jgi:hypothetical protein